MLSLSNIFCLLLGPWRTRIPWFLFYVWKTWKEKADVACQPVVFCYKKGPSCWMSQCDQMASTVPPAATSPLALAYLAITNAPVFPVTPPTRRNTLPWVTLFPSSLTDTLWLQPGNENKERKWRGENMRQTWPSEHLDMNSTFSREMRLFVFTK